MVGVAEGQGGGGHKGMLRVSRNEREPLTKAEGAHGGKGEGARKDQKPFTCGRTDGQKRR